MAAASYGSDSKPASSTSDPPTIALSSSSSSSSAADLSSSVAPLQLTFPFPSARSSPLPTEPHSWLPAFAGKLLQGTCGWTDSSILRGAHFYPPHIHSAVDRLRHYSAYFPCVEVDSSNYAIPPPSRVSSWLAVTPAGFLFHFKVFGLFTSLSIKVDALPGPLRDQVPAAIAASSQPVRLDSLPASYISSLWQYWNTAILPAHAAAKLGLVIFQFQLSFAPSDAHRQHVEWCRRQLCSAYRMGVEFRDRRWIKGEEGRRTLRWLAELDLTYIVCDDLEQETYRPGREPIGEDKQLAVVHATSSSHSLYVRLHRRTGDNRGDRVLAATEFTQWADRLRDEQEAADRDRRRSVFFLWGTDCVDDPITNARKMGEALRDRAASLWLDWRELRKDGMKQRSGGNLLALFAKQEKRNRETAEGRKDDEGSGEERSSVQVRSSGVEQAMAGTGSSATADGARLAERKEDAASHKKRRTESEGQTPAEEKEEEEAAG